MSSRRPLALIPFALLAAAAANALAEDPVANALTIYSSAPAGAVPVDLFRAGGQPGYAVPGYAVVRHERPIDLTPGRNEVRFTDVAGFIDPTTVSFQSLTDPAGTRVVEQNFQFDLVSTDKLLQKFVDRRITVDQVRGDHTESVAGTLLSTQGGIVLLQDDGTVKTLSHNASVTLPSLPGGLITRPTLVWDLFAGKPGRHTARVAYQTTGITWWTDYNLTYAEGRGLQDCRLDVGAWVSILNQSGASYPDARLKLIAGDVHRAPAAAPSPKLMMRAAEAMVADAPAGFVEKQFFEYHLYTLGRPTSLPDNSTKQIELFPALAGVTCEKTLVYVGAADYGVGGEPYVDRNFGPTGNRKVDTYLSFRNAQENGMGVALPAGRVRVSKLDPADGTLEFIGEDRIDHTPRNETVLLKLGSAFDVVGERRQTDFKLDTGRKTMTEEIEVRIRNRKDVPVKVIVKENLYRWSQWRITAATHEYQKQDARTVHFPLVVGEDREAVLRYTVRYTW
ncbi:MAG: hypothetical protein U1F52_03065 [Burkholderiales bacterium]